VIGADHQVGLACCGEVDGIAHGFGAGFDRHLRRAREGDRGVAGVIEDRVSCAAT
jgi:hypothetical protein